MGAPAEPARAIRQKQTRLCVEQVDELVRAYRNGDSVPTLAKAFEVNETTVRAHLERRGVETRGNRGYRKLHGELLARATELYAAGLSLRSVSSELGLAREAVRSGLREGGVVLRSR